MFRPIAALLLCLAGLPGHAACTGTDLLAELPPATRQALTDAAASQPYPEGILWRAENGDRVIHLVGTMHFADPRHDATMERIMPLIDRAGAVFLEMGDGDEARVNALMAENPGLAFIVDGPTLPELLSPADWTALNRAMADRGVPGFLAAKMQPWFAMVNLGLSKCALQQVATGQSGIDQTITAYAASIGKPARGLEPFDTVFNLFIAYSDDELLEFLRLSLATELNDPDDQHTTMANAYFREEIRLMWEYSLHQALSYPGSTEMETRTEMAKLEDVLVANRNRAWLGRILPASDEGEVLVAAGALHLPGNVGLLHLLEEQGFIITRIPRQP